MKNISWLLIFILNSWAASAQISLTNGSPSASQDFDAMAATLNLPANWRMHASAASPIWVNGVTTVTQQASSGTPTTGGTYNWGTTGGTERAVGAMTSSGFASPNNLMSQFVNNGTSNILSISISYDAERYRINTAAASVQFYWSLNGSTWTAVGAGDIAAASFPAGASSYTFASPLIVNVAAFSVTGLAIAPASNFYLRWNVNTTGSNSQGIGIDNVSVTATFASAGPEIQLQEPLDNNLACGATLDFGSVGVTTSSGKTVRIKNIGTSTLNLTNTPLLITGPDAAEFDISSQPYTSAIPVNGYADFVVDFNPTSTGAKTAAISIDNNDSDENPCAINLTATGIPNEAEIQLEYPVATQVACGAATMAFGNTAVGMSSSSLTFRIKNPGAQDLNLTTLPLVISGSDPGEFVISIQPSSPIAASSTSFSDVSVVFSPTSGGAKTAIISIDNNDSDENPCAINLSGTGTQSVHFRTTGNGNWNDFAIWETSPDLMTWTPAASPPTSADLTIQIQGGHIVGVPTSVTVDEFTIASGGQMNLNSGVTFTVANGSSDDMTVSGIFKNNGGTISLTGTLIIAGTGVFQHNFTGAGSNVIPIATWQTGSTLEILASNNAKPTNLNQVFHHLIWNNASQTANINLTGDPSTVNGNFTVQDDGSSSGTLRYNANSPAAPTLTIHGNLTVATGATFDLSSGTSNPTVNLKGDLSVSGTLTETGAGSSNLLLNGTSNQNLTGDGTISNTIPLALNNAAGATLLSDLTLPNSLTCTTGKLTLGIFNLTVSGPTMTGSTNSYVKTTSTGELRHSVTSSSLLFPIGNSTFNPVTLSLSAGTATLGTRVLDAVYTNGLTGPLLTEKVVNRTWDLNGTLPGGSTLNLTTQWVLADELTNFDRNNCYISHYVAGWNQDAPTAAAGSDPFMQTRIGVGSLSPFAVGSTGALPLEWASFSASIFEKINRLDWQTASENSVREFIAERSADNQNWFEFDKKQAVGNSQQLNFYSVYDEKPVTKSWYRIRAVDFDGRESLSKVIFLERETAASSMQIFPNPAEAGAFVLLNLEVETEVELTIFDVVGKVVLYQKMNLAKGENRLPVHSENLAAGIYQVLLTGFAPVRLVKN